jgi:molecular chaperone GrpE
MSDDGKKPETPESANDNPFGAEFAVLEALKNENESLKDQRLRALAEAENIRRRAEREKAEASQYAVTKFARDMLGIADNFSRALAACPPALREAADPQIRAVLDGVEATDRQLLATLERYGVKPVETAGKFDPNLHQAIAEVPGNGKAPGEIVDVVQAGYRIGDRLLRPAMVTVARREQPPENRAPSPTGDKIDTKV